MTSSPATSATPRTAPFRNWGRCWGSCQPAEEYFPATAEDVQQILRRANESPSSASSSGGGIRIVGRGMAPSDMLFTTGAFLRTDRMARVLRVDPAARLVTFGAGATIADVSAALVPHALVLPTALSVKRCSMAASCLVAAHGTSFRDRSLASCIVEVAGVTGAGELLRASELTGENADLLPALRCSMGVLMCVTEMTLRVDPRVAHVMESGDTNIETVLRRLPERRATCSHYKFVWVPWSGGHCYETWATPSAPSSAAPSTAVTTTAAVSPDEIARRTASAHHCASDGNNSWTCRLTEIALYLAHDNRRLLSVVNRLFARLVLSGRSAVRDADGMDINYLDVLFQHVTLEWALPAARCEAAVREWIAMVEDKSSKLIVHFPLEVRFMVADDAERVWLSPAGSTTKSSGGSGGGDDGIVAWLGIVIFRPFELESSALRYTCNAFQDLMLRHGGRSHWSKPFEVSPATLHAWYPRLRDFEALRRRLDPRGILTNEWYRRKHVASPLAEQNLQLPTPLARSSKL